jgi:threonine dehydrogenase-like Zn-dependent dehydrogenase
VFHGIGDIRLDDVKEPKVEPSKVLTEREPLTEVLEAYKAFSAPRERRRARCHQASKLI